MSKNKNLDVDLRMMNHDFLREFIHMWRERPVLWDKKHEEYLSDGARFSAYIDLREKLMEVDENATIETVKNKIQGMRTVFRRELRRLEAAEKSGKEYITKLWYFSELLFSTDKEIPKAVLDKIKSENAIKDLIKYEEETRMPVLCLRTQQSVKHFIKLFKKHECLWNLKSKHYKNKIMKLKALESMRKVFTKYSKNASILSIKNKIKSLRICFKRELRKVESARKKGEIYTPSLYYFKDLLFLVENGSEISSLLEGPDSNDEDIEEDYKEFENIDIESFKKPSSTKKNVKEKKNVVEYIPKKDKQPKEYINEDSNDNKNDDSEKQYNEFENTDVEDIYSQTHSEDYLEHFQQKIKKQSKIKDNGSNLEEVNNKEDEISSYTKYIGYELRLLSSEDRNFVQKLFNDTLFEAKKGNANKLTLNKK